MSEPQPPDEARQLVHAIASLEAQRAVLGDAVVDPLIAAAREKLAALEAAGPPAAELRGERRRATILMADVKGSTELAGKIGTETWVEIMNHVFHLLGDVIYYYGGEIDQYRGDGLVAFFGAREAHEDDPDRAVRAGLAAQAAVIAYAAELRVQYGIELLMRVGINSGEVIAARVGDRRQHSEDTAMGRAIALAARMETAAQPGTVLVSAHTYHLTRPLFEWQALGEVPAKGYSQPVPAYRPLAARADVGKVRGIEGLSAPLVGRDAEFDALCAAVDGLQRGLGGIVTLVGEAGLGKSRLVAELRKSALSAAPTSPNLKSPPDPRSGLNWFEGRCLSYGGSMAYLLWQNMLRGFLSVAQDARPEVVRETLRARVRALCPDCFDAVYPYLCRLLSLPLEDGPLKEGYAVARDLQGESLRAEVFNAMLTVIESAARQQPLVLVCEDLHWADDTSLALLERVLALTDRCALLIICVLRPEAEHGCWQLRETAARLYRHRHTDLWLDALSTDESQALVGHLLRVEDLPEGLRAQILERAEGNPFYVEEIIRTLIDDGVAVYDADTGQWHAQHERVEIPLPDTLHGVLVARIDRLQEETRRVLRLASAIGRVFSYRVLAEVAQEEQLETRLLTLQRQQLIRERARLPELEYIFKHELTREAAYSGLLDRERRACHRRVAETLERLFPDQVDERAGLLAHHWERAEEPAKAVGYLVAAGEQSRRAYANQEAADYYQRALATMDDLGPDAPHAKERLAALSGLGKVYLQGSRLADADRPLRQAIDLARACGLPGREQVNLYWWLGEALFWQNRYEDGIKLGQEGLALLGDETGSVETALMHHGLAVAYRGMGNWTKAREQIQRAAEVVLGLPYAEELRPVFINASDLLYMGTRNTREAERWLAALEERARRHHDLRALAEVHYWTGTLRWRQGALEQALVEYERAYESFSLIGDNRFGALILSCQYLTHLTRGALSTADKYARRLSEWLESSGSPSTRLFEMGLAGLVALYQGRSEEAIRPLRKAFDIAHERQIAPYAGFFGRYLARAYLALGRRRQALTLLQTPHILDDAIVPEPTLVKVLSMLEQACETSEDWDLSCSQLRAQSMQGPRYAPFVCWQLSPVQEEPVPPEGPHDASSAFARPGWAWVDPEGDCSYRVDEGLVILAANGRDMWNINWSAPRMVRQTSGDVGVQTVCVPARDDRPAIGGLLLWADERNYLRLDRGVADEHEITFLGCVNNQDVIVGRGRLHEASNRIVLRLERVGSQVRAFCRVEGGPWFTVGHVTFPAADPIQVGPHAIGSIDRTIYSGAYPEGTAIRFESFQMWAT